MDRELLARQLASLRQISPSQAADELDQAVHHILKKLRRGQTVSLPGIGTLRSADGKPVLQHRRKRRAAAQRRKRSSRG